MTSDEPIRHMRAHLSRSRACWASTVVGSDPMDATDDYRPTLTVRSRTAFFLCCAREKQMLVILFTDANF